MGISILCSFFTASSEIELNYKPKNTIVAMAGICSILKTNTGSKTNIMRHNHTFGGLRKYGGGSLCISFATFEMVQAKFQKGELNRILKTNTSRYILRASKV